MKDTKETVKAVSDFCNSFTPDNKGFVEGMSREHRTLQQAFTGLAVSWLMHLASLKDGEFDGRNEASVQLAKKLLDGKDRYDLALPMI
jgi:hypothetical protein